MIINRYNGRFVNMLIKTVLFFLTSFYIVGCKTSKNGYSKMPQARYDLAEERKNEYESFNQTDTVVFLTLGSGYLRGSEHNHYSIRKNNDKTIINRTSNFQKFGKIEITSSNFPWQYILDNYNKFTYDTIKTEKKIISEDGKTVYQLAASHGKTTFLEVKLGLKEHRVYLAPLVDSYNAGNINLDLIEKIKDTILTLEFNPSEKIRYKRER